MLVSFSTPVVDPAVRWEVDVARGALRGRGVDAAFDRALVVGLDDSTRRRRPNERGAGGAGNDDL